jgi:hypothetical protein
LKDGKPIELVPIPNSREDVSLIIALRERAGDLLQLAFEVARISPSTGEHGKESCFYCGTNLPTVHGHATSCAWSIATRLKNDD